MKVVEAIERVSELPDGSTLVAKPPLIWGADAKEVMLDEKLCVPDPVLKAGYQYVLEKEEIADLLQMIAKKRMSARTRAEFVPTETRLRPTFKPRTAQRRIRLPLQIHRRPQPIHDWRLIRPTPRCADEHPAGSRRHRTRSPRGVLPLALQRGGPQTRVRHADREI